MVHRIAACASAFVGLGWLCLCGPAAGADGARIVAERPLDARGVELTVATPAFSAPTRVQVFLPAGYDADPNRRWPVTYYLHGAQGDAARFHAWYGNLVRDYPSIVVSPDGGQIGFYSDWYNGGAGGPPMYETYDIDQLIPLIDARFRTIARRAGRAVIGESMGGYGVLTYAARHPDLFAVAASLSGFIDSNYVPEIGLISAGPPLQGGRPDAIYGSRVTQEVRWHGHNPTDLADNLRGVDLQVRTGEGVPTQTVEGPDPSSAVGCTEESGVFQTNLAFRERLLALRIPHVWKDYGPACHSIPNFRHELTDSLPGLERVFAHPVPDPTTFGYRSIEPHFTIWGWRVDADPARALEFLALQDARRGGVTLVGSGTTTVTTPAIFRGLRAVDVVNPAGTQVLAPDRDGRLRFRVDLGPAHPDQQDTDASRAAGDGTAGYFTRRSVRFAPHARLVIPAARRIGRTGLRACVRSIGPALRHGGLVLRDARGRPVARRRALVIGSPTRCALLRASRPLRRGSYAVQATATDAFGHRVSARRGVRFP